MDNEKTGWRIQIAKDIKKKNPQLSADFITRVVQLIIDRFIFIKVLSDREIEDDYLTEIIHNIDKALIKSEEGNLDDSCRDVFTKLNRVYNGSVFAPKTELEHVRLSNKVIKSILSDFLPENSPYNFKQIPVEVLGTIYEQFLGKVIETTDKRATVEYKPEVRKAGGVYYTPQYIVEYIVENTVGEKLKECKTIDDVFKIKICDPACGSGSFLLGAYDCLLNWCVEHYAKSLKPGAGLSKKQAEHVYPDADGQVRLTSKLRREILRNCIYGVDIDPQAVEVAITSLSLKALEGTRHDELYAEVDLFHETVLPNLEGNIKCGNSLIEEDFYENKELSLFSTDDMRKVNTFDWWKEFSEKGFDCVIGNPPYVRQESLGEYKTYFQKKYKVYHGVADLYTYFIEKSISILKPNGRFSFIVANKWMRANYGGPLRNFIKENISIEKIIDFGELPVFEGAATFPSILIFLNKKVENQNFIYAPIKRLQFDSLTNEIDSIKIEMDSSALGTDSWTLSAKNQVALIEKIKKAGVPLGDYVNGKIYRGVLTGLNEAFVINKTIKDRLIADDPKSSEIIKPFANGDDIRRYHIRNNERYLIYFQKGFTNLHSGNEKNKWSYLKNNYKAISNHLESFEDKGKKRADQGDYWWELRSCDYFEEFAKPKIIYPDIAKESRFCYDSEGYFVTNTVYFIPRDDLHLLGLLNSKLIFWYYKKIAAVLGDANKGGRLRFFSQDVIKLPILPELGNGSIKELVKSNLKNYSELQKIHSDLEKKALLQKAQLIDKQIDQLVYQLYGLTEEEIKIVEEVK